MKRVILSLLTIVLLLSCSRTSEYSNDFGSSIEVGKNVSISRFSLSNTVLKLDDTITNVVVKLYSHSNGSKYEFKGDAVISKETVEVAMAISPEQVLPDSDYSLVLCDYEGNSFSYKYDVTIKNLMVSAVRSCVFFCNLEGDGTLENPYLIGDDQDFYNFLKMIKDDSEHCKGVFFAQSGDIVVPDQGTGGDGVGHIGQEFAGHYDGRHHRLSDMTYYGTASSKDKNIGLFSILHDGASISNLTIDNCNIDSALENVGFLAGSSKGNVSIDSVRVDGIIHTNSIYVQEGKIADNVGGFIGYAEEGTVSITNSSFVVNLDGEDNVGGAIGYGNNITLDIKFLSSTSFERVIGNSYVGGVIGQLSGILNIEGFMIIHKDLEALIAEKDYLGGIAGSISLKGKSTIKDVSVKLSIKGGETSHCIGGLIGEVISSVSVQELVLKGVVSGDSDCVLMGNSQVGGFIGSSISVDIVFPTSFGNHQCMNVNGYKYVGGCFGWIQSGKITVLERVEVATSINSNLTGTEYVGGFAGNISDAYLDISDKIEISKSTVINGLNKVGGFAGYCYNSEIIGKNSLIFNNITIVDTNTFSSPIFKGFINRKESEMTFDAGGFIGCAENSEISKVVSAGSVSGVYSIGGLIGSCINSSVENCVTKGAIITGTEDRIGGVIGHYYHTDSDAYLHNLINMTEKVNGRNDVGGVIGKVESNSTYIDYCVNLGGVYGKGDGPLGGVVGYMDDGYKEITNCANFGTVTGNGGSGIGGILGTGETYVRIQKSVNKGTVKILSGSYYGIGGVVGKIGSDSGLENYDNDLNIVECCNYGEIYVVDNTDCCMGGIVGTINDGCATKETVNINDCYNAGAISGKPSNNPGGIVGVFGQHVNVFRCVNTGQVEAPLGNGIAGTPAEYVYIYDLYNNYLHTGKSCITEGDTGFDDITGKDQSTFSNLDFDSTWMMGSITSSYLINEGYPILRDCFFQTAHY